MSKKSRALAGGSGHRASQHAKLPRECLRGICSWHSGAFRGNEGWIERMGP